MHPPPVPTVAFLVDADNLNDPDAVAEAFDKLHELAGPSTIRRAYGAAESLKGIAPALKAYAVRPCANFLLEKSTTDVALVVDAMEIACTAAAPVVLAIGSGDADFFPLVARLRERGVRVIGFSLHGKMSEEMKPVYAELFMVGRARKPGAGRAPAAAQAPAPPAAPVPARKAAARKSPVRPAAPPTDNDTSSNSTPVPVPMPKPAASGVPAKKVAAKKTGAAAELPTLARILATVPQLRSGEPVHLSDASKALHAASIIGKSASCTRLFSKYPGEFELTPGQQPNHVRWIARGAA